MYPKITFSIVRNENEQSKLTASLDTAGLPETDARVRHARLGMHFTAHMLANIDLPFSAFSPGDNTTCELGFSNKALQGDGDAFYEYGDSSFYGFDDELSYYNDPVMPAPDDGTVALVMKVNGLNSVYDQPFGWAASPAFQAVTAIAQQVRLYMEKQIELHNQAQLKSAQDNVQSPSIDGPGF